MSLLSPELLHRLARSKFYLRQAVAQGGIGERRSRAKGAGIEFADHRPYQLGDDIRHLDQHVYARLGEHHIRQFSLYQQLQVTLLLDTSASMAFGQPAKLGFAKALSAGLAYVALAGGDSVRIGAFGSGHIRWSAAFRGVRRAPELFHWLERLESQRHTGLGRAARLAVGKLKPESLLIVVSDWLSGEVETALRTLDLKRQELVAVLVLAPEEAEPERLGRGDLRLVDTESGQEFELALDAEALASYRENLETWTSSLRSLVRSRQGLFLQTRSDAELETLFGSDWRKEGLIV